MFRGLPRLALGMANSGPLSNEIKAVVDNIVEAGRTLDAATVQAELAALRIVVVDDTLRKANLDPRKVELLERKRKQLLEEELKHMCREVMLRDKKLEFLEEEFKLMAEELKLRGEELVDKE